MKVIDILLEAEVPGGVSGKVARLILPAAARTWNAEKQAAFREAVKALEETLYLAKSQPTPLTVSNVDAYKVVNKAAPNHVADKEFTQAVFTAADERVAQRIAAEDAAHAGQLAKEKGEAESSAKAAAKKSEEEKIRKGGFKGTAAQKAEAFMKWFGVPGYIAYDAVFNAYSEYAKNQEWALGEVKAGRMSAEKAKAYDSQQKTLLVYNIAASSFPITYILGKWILKVPLKLLGIVKFRKVDSATKKVEEVPLDEILSDAKTNALKKAGWVAMIAYMNSDATYSTANWNIYDDNGNPIGKVGRPMTFREILAYLATNHNIANDTIADLADDFNAGWNATMPAAVNYTTQKQDIEKAAGKSVTPNIVQKKQKTGNTTWQGDWKD